MADVKTITSMMGEKRVFNPPKVFSEQSYIRNLVEYKEVYQWSIKDPEGFWGEMAGQLDWYKKWDKVLVEDFKEGKHEWFVGGKLNVSQNCLDRHVKTWRRNKAALIWEGDIGDTKVLTYQQLYRQVCKFANVLKKHGVKKGDRISIYLPMIVELPIAMLACARIGAIHSVVFGGFSADGLSFFDADLR
jgi:acetyl-CoA synthetase